MELASEPHECGPAAPPRLGQSRRAEPRANREPGRCNEAWAGSPEDSSGGDAAGGAVVLEGKRDARRWGSWGWGVLSWAAKGGLCPERAAGQAV